MANLSNNLFTVEEVLFRLGQNKRQGCLSVSAGTELILIYVQDGFVTNASSGLRTGKEAVAHALHVTDSSHHWIQGVQPPDPVRNSFLNIQELVLKSGSLYRDKIGETGKLSGKAVEPKDESEYSYVLVPHNQPTSKLYLTRQSTTVGRSATADWVVEDKNVSSRHCILDYHKRGLFVIDLDSTNGTYVNGKLIKDSYLNPGDVLELGDYRFTVNRELLPKPEPVG